MQGTEVIAFHGWGFNASCWEGWEQVFGNKSTFETFERGYFGAAKRTPIFTGKETVKIVVTHSFGLHLCPDELFREADLLIICNGFISFHPEAAQYRRRSRLVVKQMLNALQGHPEKVLHDFYENTFKPQDPGAVPINSIDNDLLTKDLQTLDTNTLELSVLKSIDKICILHGFKDAIVHRRKGRTLYDNLSGQAKYFEIKNAGHALPFTHKDQCRQFIEPEFKNLNC